MLALFSGLVLLFTIITPASAWSVVTTLDTPLPPDTSSDLYQVRDGDAAYVAPTNGYSDGGVTAYCLLTQDPAKAAQTSVTAPDGNSYPLTAVYVGTSVSAASACIGANKTLFVDAGTYNSDLEYVGLSATNFSLVGLTKTAGEPAAILKRTYSTSTSSVVDQYRFYHANVHLENLILDGAGKNMYDNQSRGWYAVVVANGSGGFVAQDVIIQNVGASSTPFNSTRNSALEVIYDQTGTHHFVNLTVRAVKTTWYGSGVIFTNQTNKTYFSNLVMDGTSAYNSTYGLRIENSNTTQMTDLTQNSAVFAGAGTKITTSTGADFIQIQDYRYDLIGVPDAYRYVEYTTHNGSGNTGAYRVYRSIPDATSSTAILDRRDGYWVVRQGQAVSTTAQIAAIQAVRTHMLGLTSPALAAARVPAANIKIAPAVGGALASFTVADFGAGIGVNLVAVPTATDLSTSTVRVPAQAGFTANFGATANSANVALYNVDYASLASYTLQEAITGVTSVAISDPNDGSYPSGLNYADYVRPTPPAITGGAITPDALRNSLFVTLAAGESASIKTLNLSVASASINVGEATTAAASVPSWYTAAAAALGASTGADDSRVAYFSSDSTIATVDQTTGVVTGVGPGTVTIYAKALDANNAGEIEKPFASTTVEVNWEPAIQLTKTADPLTGTAIAGTPVTYRFMVTNTGNIPLTNIGVTDPLLGQISCQASELAPGESTECTGDVYELTQADIDAGQVVNTATASGTPPATEAVPSPSAVTAEATVVTVLVREPEPVPSTEPNVGVNEPGVLASTGSDIPLWGFWVAAAASLGGLGLLWRGSRRELNPVVVRSTNR